MNLDTLKLGLAMAAFVLAGWALVDDDRRPPRLRTWVKATALALAALHVVHALATG